MNSVIGADETLKNAGRMPMMIISCISPILVHLEENVYMKNLRYAIGNI